MSNQSGKMEKQRVILAGDIGGTKANLGLFSIGYGELCLIQQASYTSYEFIRLEDIIDNFLSKYPYFIEKACFGIAGPILNDQVKTSNLPWIIIKKNLQTCLKMEKVGLINDLEATAYGMLHLKKDDWVTLKEGSTEAKGAIAIIAAGTGLGEAFLYWDGHQYQVAASEGGHTDFAPRTEIEIELLKFLLRKYEHVSYERLLSGPGISNIYDFLRTYRNIEQPQWLTERMKQEDKNAVITEAALAGTDNICTETLNMFTAFYGAEAGNLALKVMAISGVYIGGGIAPKIINKLQDGTFSTAFVRKGRLTDVLAKIPVRVAMNEKTALIGAAYYALDHVQ